MNGAFKHYPIDQQPERIPLDKFDALAEAVTERWGHLFSQMFIPNAHKKAMGRVDTGDMDIVIVPKQGSEKSGNSFWRRDILVRKNYHNDKWHKLANAPIDENIVAHESNGPQLMLVVKDLLGDGKQDRIDFLLTTTQSFEFKKFFHGHGTIVPALIGSFARSCGYKYDSQAFFIRLKDTKDNFHNIMLTRDINEVFQLLMLDPVQFEDPILFDPNGVATWISNSPRYDWDVWNKPRFVDGRNLVVENRKAHAAAKKKQEVQDTYDILRNIKKSATVTNNDYEIEKRIFGSDRVEKIIAKATAVDKKCRQILSGKDIMDILKIEPGPEVGKWIKWLNVRDEFKGLTDAELKTDEIRAKATELLITHNL